MDQDRSGPDRPATTRVARGSPRHVPPAIRERAEDAVGGPVTFVDLGARDRFLGLGERLVVRLAATPAAAQTIQRETRRLRWAAERGVPVPEIVAEQDGLQVATRERDDAHVGSGFVHAVTEALQRLADAGPVPPDLLEPATDQRSRWSRVRAVARLARHGVDLAAFRNARAEVELLADEVPVHGDLNHENVLFDAHNGEVRLVDWELLSTGPRGHDLLTLWPQVTDPETRGLLTASVRELGVEPPAAASQIRWASRQQLAALIHEGVSDRDTLATARAAVTAGDELAASWTSVPGSAGIRPDSG